MDFSPLVVVEAGIGWCSCSRLTGIGWCSGLTGIGWLVDYVECAGKDCGGGLCNFHERKAVVQETRTF